MHIANPFVSLSLAFAIPLSLAVLGFVSFFRLRKVRSISAVVLAVGLSLLTLTIVQLLTSRAGLLYPFDGSVWALIVLPLLVYAATPLALARRSDVSRLRLLVSAIVGLIPLYYLGGYILILTACGADKGGC